MTAGGRCLACCRLLPLHQPYAVRDMREGPIVESWGRFLFQNARRDPGQVLVRVGHRTGPEVARLSSLIVHGDWLHADFVFDAELQDVIVPGLGVSVGVELIPETGAPPPVGRRRHRETGLLEEISLTRRPSVPGARVVSVTRMKPAEPVVVREPLRPSPRRGAQQVRVIQGSSRPLLGGGELLIRPGIGQILGVR